jgi:molybdopterin converting factor small subunit
MKVKVNIVLLSRFSIFAEKLQDGILEVAPGSTVKDVAATLGMAEKDLRIVLVDGRQAKKDTVVLDSSTVIFVPPVAGGG